MKKGDKVKFVGDFDKFINSVQVTLRRTGEIVNFGYESGRYKGKVLVSWIPKTKRGRPETFFMDPSEIEII